MIKKFFLALALSAGLLSPAFAAGTLPGFSLSQQMGADGKPLAGCKLYIIQAGTTSTPQTAYQDSALTIPMPGGSQLTCDAAGRIGQFFLADGSVKIRLTDASGVTQITADGLLVVGPSGGGGGGSTVDPTTILTTGDIKVSYGASILTGFVRVNGRSIGSATSGATERANADCQALFQYLWGADAALAVSGGRGVSAAADWAANKTITLPDARGRSIFAADDMGNAAAGRLTTALSGVNGVVVGAVGGLQNQNIAQSQLPNVAPAFTGIAGTVSINSTRSDVLFGAPAGVFTSSGSGNGTLTGSGFGSGILTSSGPFTPSGAISSINGGVTQAGLIMVPPAIVMTVYMKL